jgi:hypothetical protein
VSVITLAQLALVSSDVRGMHGIFAQTLQLEGYSMKAKQVPTGKKRACD